MSWSGWAVAGTYHSVGSGWANASNTPWRMYKHYSHEGGISTPCIVHWPAGFRRRNAIESAPAHLIDLMPTIVEASGANYPRRLDTREILPMAGISLVPALRGERMPERALYFEHEGTRAVREGRYKLTALRGESWKLYDMERDRTELEDLAGQATAAGRVPREEVGCVGRRESGHAAAGDLSRQVPAPELTRLHLREAGKLPLPIS